MTFKLDDRLKTIADCVRAGVVVADIGTDHGYLVCNLVATGKNPKAFACDIAEAPLESARQTIAQNKLELYITAVMTDGLEGISPQDVDDIVIAGMGGQLICDIISRWEGSKNPAKRFVLQPMSKADYLRRFLYKNGFEILSETAVISGSFVYTVMVVRFCGKISEIDTLFAQTGKLLRNGGKPAMRYLEMIANTLNKKALGIKNSDPENKEADELLECTEVINNLLNR